MQELLNFLEAHGFSDFEPILNTKEYIRFDRTGRQTGWFKGKDNIYKNIITAWFGDWKTSESYYFESSNVSGLTDEEKKEFKQKMEEYKKNEELQEKEKNLSAQQIAKEDWEVAGTTDSPYLLKKGFGPGITASLGLRTIVNHWGIDLYVPLKDIEGNIWSIQTITESGEKLFQSGGRITGLFHQLGSIAANTQKIYIAEGIATAASIWVATNTPTICAFNAGNLSAVTQVFRKKYPQLPIIVAGDDDKYTLVNGEYKNTGRDAANKAASLCNGIAVFPIFKNEDTKPTDFNDLHVLEGLTTIQEQFNALVPPNPKELIKTQKTGFHTVVINDKGKATYKPNYDDLYLYFNKKYNYKILDNSGVCLVWDGRCYKEFSENMIASFAEEEFFPKPDNNKVSQFMGKIGRKNIKDAKWFLDSTANKLNFQNGVLDKETEKFEPHNPNYGFRYTLNYRYDPNAKCPVFDKFLKDVSKGDVEKERMLLEFMGYAISNDECFLQKALILEGEGSNGKSTLCLILQELAGEANFSTISLSHLDKMERVSSLDGKLFNISEETSADVFRDPATFKQLAGGGYITARKLRENSYQFFNKTKIILLCNELPNTKDTSYGLSRKFIIIPFRAIFTDDLGNKDGTINEKLAAELPGIFNRVWAAYKVCRKNRKLSPCEDAKEALAAYTELIDTAKTWITNNLQFHALGNGMDNKSLTISEIYNDYRIDMENAGETPITQMAFSRKLGKICKDFKLRHSQKRHEGKRESILIATTRYIGDDIHAV